MAEIWFSSDPHFGHAKIIEPGYVTDRHKARLDFATLDEMHETIVERHNAVVKPTDHWYCLGDVAFTDEDVLTWVPRLNSTHKRLLLGNHDERKMKVYQEAGFKKIMSYRIFEHVKDVLFSHIPIAPWSLNDVNVHGHCHRGKPFMYQRDNPDEEGFKKMKRYLNISMEHTNFAPINLDQIQTLLKRWL